MESKAILVSLIAIFAVLALTSFVQAADLVRSGYGDFRVSIKGVEFVGQFGDTVEADAGETIPIRVVFVAGTNASDVKVRASISGYRDDLIESTGRFDIIEGTTYSKLLSLKVPTDVDPAEDFTLEIEVISKKDSFEAEFPLVIQRESYNVEVLSVETDRQVAAGSTLAVTVVLKNRGSHRLDDTFVVAKIPALDVERRVYFSDLSPVDDCEDDCDKEDAAERTLYLSIPSDAQAGVYSLEVEASNPDASETVTKSISVVGSGQSSDVLTTVTTKDVEAGGTVSYDLVIVNSGDTIAVYNIVPESAQNLVVSVDEPVVTVAAGSSKTVRVNAQAGDVMGTFNFAVNVNSQDNLVEKVNFTANVGKKTVTSNVMILTVVLAIVFVVLLVVLIVLLTRKPEKTEEFGESYY